MSATHEFSQRPMDVAAEHVRPRFLGLCSISPISGSIVATILALTPAHAEQITVRDLNGPSFNKAGEIFQWAETEEAYFTMVPDLSELWRVSAEGHLMERASVLGDGQTLTLLWDTSVRDVFHLDELLEINFTGQHVALAQNIATLLTWPLGEDAFDLPKGARFSANRAVVDPGGQHLGNWDVATGGIVTLTDFTGERDVPITKLLEVLGGV